MVGMVETSGTLCWLGGLRVIYRLEVAGEVFGIRVAHEDLVRIDAHEIVIGGEHYIRCRVWIWREAWNFERS